MRLRAVRTEAKYLKPGDLFTDKGPAYWNNLKFPSEVIYICIGRLDDEDELYYKLTTVHEDSHNEKVKITEQIVNHEDTFDFLLPPGM